MQVQRDGQGQTLLESRAEGYQEETCKSPSLSRLSCNVSAETISLCTQ